MIAESVARANFARMVPWPAAVSEGTLDQSLEGCACEGLPTSVDDE